MLKINTSTGADRQIAKSLGVDNSTVSAHRKEMVEKGELLESNTSTGADRQIAKALGVNHETVGIQRKQLEATGGIRQFETNIGADDKERRVMYQHGHVLA